MEISTLDLWNFGQSICRSVQEGASEVPQNGNGMTQMSYEVAESVADFAGQSVTP